MSEPTPTPMPDDLPMLEPCEDREPIDDPIVLPPIAECPQQCEESTAPPAPAPDSGRALADTGADPVASILLAAALTIAGTIALAARQVRRS